MTDDEIPYINAFRGMIADYYDGLVSDEGMMSAMELLSRDDVATSLGMYSVHADELAPGETAAEPRTTNRTPIPRKSTTRRRSTPAGPAG